LYSALRQIRTGASPSDPVDARTWHRSARYKGRLRSHINNRDHQTQGRREGVASTFNNIFRDFSKLKTELVDQNGAMALALENVATVAAGTEFDARQSSNDRGGFWHNDFSEDAIEVVSESIDRVIELLSNRDEESTGTSEDDPTYFDVRELPNWVEAIAAEGPGGDQAQYVETLNMRIRGLFARSQISNVAIPDPAISLDAWLDDYVGAEDSENGQIAIVDLSLLPSDVVHIVVAVLTRLIFEALQRYRRQTGNELPTVLVLEEAHTFLHRDLSRSEHVTPGALCFESIERIAREGRKFGLGLVLSSQRPSEISRTILSQCNTFLLHRIVSDDDQAFVRRLIPDALGEMLRELPSLPSKRAILLGWAAQAPIVVEMNELAEDFRPNSPDPKYWEVWTGDPSLGDRPIDWGKITGPWTTGSTNESEATTGDGEESLATEDP
jgi:hypothetical protein